MARFADDDLIIDFDNFVRCLIRLETLFSKWPFPHGTRGLAVQLRVGILPSLGKEGRNDGLGDQ